MEDEEVPHGLALVAPPVGTLPIGPVEQVAEEQMDDDLWADDAPVISRPPAERVRDSSRSPRGHNSGEAGAADAPELPLYMASFHRLIDHDGLIAATLMTGGCPAHLHQVGVGVVLAGIITNPAMNGKRATIVAWDAAMNAYLCMLGDELWMVPPQCLVTA